MGGAKNHCSILKDKGIYYSDKDSLINDLVSFKRSAAGSGASWNAYSEYSPEAVMSNFKSIFMNGSFCNPGGHALQNDHAPHGEGGQGEEGHLGQLKTKHLQQALAAEDDFSKEDNHIQQQRRGEKKKIQQQQKNHTEKMRRPEKRGKWVSESKDCEYSESDLVDLWAGTDIDEHEMV